MAQRVMVGMSGGVDSSVAALLLQQQGWQVTGGHAAPAGRRLQEQGGEDAEKDIQDAARVCAALGIAHQVLDLSEDFRRHVVDAFAQEYLAGRTPNPCSGMQPHRQIWRDAGLCFGAGDGLRGHRALCPRGL